MRGTKHIHGEQIYMYSIAIATVYIHPIFVEWKERREMMGQRNTDTFVLGHIAVC